MSTSDNKRGQQHTRRDRQIDETVHDSYKARYKPQEPSVCPTCVCSTNTNAGIGNQGRPVHRSSELESGGYAKDELAVQDVNVKP